MLGIYIVLQKYRNVVIPEIEINVKSFCDLLSKSCNNSTV